MTIGDRIKKIRREFDLTQEAFASRIGSVQNTITGYESGRRNPSAPVISLICREFGVNEEWLRDGIGDMRVPDPDNELEALAKKYKLTAADQMLIEKYVSLLLLLCRNPQGIIQMSLIRRKNLSRSSRLLKTRTQKGDLGKTTQSLMFGPLSY